MAIIWQRTYCTKGKSLAVNNFYWRTAIPVLDLSQTQACSARLHLSIGDLVVVSMSNQATYRGTVIQANVDTFPPIQWQTTTPTRPGNQVGSALPSQLCALIRRFTEPPWPKRHKRTYLPFLPRSALGSAGQLTPAFVTLIDTVAFLLTTDVVVPHIGGAITLSPWNWPSELYAQGRLVLWNADSRIATQRRRGEAGKPADVPWA